MITSINLLQTVFPIGRKIYEKIVTELLQKIQIDYNFLKNIDIFAKIDKILLRRNIVMAKRRELL